MTYPPSYTQFDPAAVGLCQPGQGSDWQNVSAIDPRAKAVICVGGVDTISQEKAMGHIRSVKGLIGDASLSAGDSPKFYSFYYPPHPDDDFINTVTDLVKIKEDGKGHPRYEYGRLIAERIKEVVFTPVLSKAHPDNAASITELKQNLAKLTFYGFSLGTYVCAHLHELVQTQLINSGYQPEQVKDILRQVHVLTVGEIAVWHTHPREGWHFTSLHLANSYDYYVGKASELPMQQPYECYLTLEKSPHTALLLHALKPEGFFVGEGKPNASDESPFTLMELALQKLSAHLQGHNPKTHVQMRIQGAPGGVFVPALLSVAVNNMIARGVVGVDRRASDLLQPKSLGEAYLATRTREYLADRQISLERWPQDWRDIAPRITTHSKEAGVAP